MKPNDLQHPGNFPDEMITKIFKEHLRFISNGEATDGIEIMAMTKMVSNMMEICFSQIDSDSNISPARWALMMRLLEEERKGNCDGITPTMMSQVRNVKKNTISSILRGMEEQGLIERNIDRSDKRIFRIRLTEKGRLLVEETSPQRVKLLNHLVSSLQIREREHLIVLLRKVMLSISSNGDLPPFPPPLD
jgi:DNA-binding MarR family transcriptional regulator